MPLKPLHAYKLQYSHPCPLVIALHYYYTPLTLELLRRSTASATPPPCAAPLPRVRAPPPCNTLPACPCCIRVGMKKWPLRGMDIENECVRLQGSQRPRLT